MMSLCLRTSYLRLGLDRSRGGLYLSYVTLQGWILITYDVLSDPVGCCAVFVSASSGVAHICNDLACEPHSLGLGWTRSTCAL